MSGEWSGDVDLNDGKLQHLYNKFQATLTRVEKNWSLNTSDVSYIKKDLENLLLPSPQILIL